MIIHYLTIAFRGLMRYRWQNLVCVLGLVIGFSAFMLGGYWRYWEHHFDDFHPNAGYLYGISTTGISKATDGTLTELNQLHKDDAEWMMENIPEIEKFTHADWTSMSYSENGKTETVVGMRVDSAFFSMFHSVFLDGDYRHVPFDRSHIVLTERTALKYFGRIDCSGELFPGGGNRKVAGVIRNYPANSDLRFDFLNLSNSNHNPPGRATYYIQLNRFARINDVREKIENHKSIAKLRFDDDANKNWSFNMRTLSDMHLKSHLDLKSRFRNITLLSVAGLLALVGSLMNHLVLFIAQQQRRQKRITIFRSMGASTSYLFLKSLVDLVIPLVLAITVTGFLIYALFPWYQTYTQWKVSYGIYKDFVNKPDIIPLIQTAVKWAGFILGFTLLAGSFIITGMLGKSGKLTPYLFRRGLIVCQVFIGSVFLFVSLSLYKQFHFSQNRDKGIRVENIIQLSADSYNGFADYSTMKEELLRSPHIEDVTFTPWPVINEMGDWYANLLAYINVDGDIYGGIGYLQIEPNFMDFFGMKMKEGEWLSSETDLVVNETQMQMITDKVTVGQTVSVLGADVKISGILHNYNYSTMQYPVMGLAFRIRNNDDNDAYQYAYIKTAPEHRAQALEHAVKVMETQQGNKVAEANQFVQLTDVMNRFNRPEQTLALIFGVLSLACVLVVSFGVYSLITLTIDQRRKEIAIRKINGAEFVDMLRLFFREYLVLLILGNLLALTLGYYMMQRWFETYSYRTTLNWWLFAVVLATTGIIVFLSVVSKINNTSRGNPAEALKYE